jgi:hypothetical protein
MPFIGGIYVNLGAKLLEKPWYEPQNVFHLIIVQRTRKEKAKGKIKLSS